MNEAFISILTSNNVTRHIRLSDLPHIYSLQVTNPWNKAVTQPSSIPTSAVKEKVVQEAPKSGNTFKDIMDSEAMRKQNFDRAKTKSLASTQDEERAIVELETFYNVANVHDEIITVARVRPQADMATPIWNPKKAQRS